MRGHNQSMPNIAEVLKAEISRLARKEIRAETTALKKAVATYRSQIADLKRRSQSLERALKQLSRGAVARPVAVAASDDTKVQGLRYSAKSLAAQRRRLGLSAADFGALIGASSLSIYHWESGKSRPRDRYIAALAAIRRLGRREAALRLAAIRGDK